MEFVPKIETVGLNLYYGDFQALKNINMRIPGRNITAIVGTFRMRQIHASAMLQ